MIESIFSTPETVGRNSRRATAKHESSVLLDSLEGAALCGMGINAFLALARSGVIPALKHGRTWRFRRADVMDWLDRQISVQTQARQEQ